MSCIKKELIVLVGNIGSGKSQFTKKLVNKKYIVVSRDSLRYMIGGGKYIFNPDIEPLIKEWALNLLEEALKRNVMVVWDETNMNRRLREPMLRLAKEYGYKTTAIVFPKLSKTEAVERRMSNPHGDFGADVWAGVWDMFDKIYQKPTKKEGFDKIIKLSKSEVGL